MFVRVGALRRGRQGRAMGAQVTNERDTPEPIIRRKVLTARNDGGTRTVIDMGDYGLLVTDEPVAHGGTGEGPSPLQTVLGALCGCEAVTFSQTAREFVSPTPGSTSRRNSRSTPAASSATGRSVPTFAPCASPLSWGPMPTSQHCLQSSRNRATVPCLQPPHRPRGRGGDAVDRSTARCVPRLR